MPREERRRPAYPVPAANTNAADNGQSVNFRAQQSR